jgi:predicted ATPase/DNA-binding SARP family transcriptional activator
LDASDDGLSVQLFGPLQVLVSGQPLLRLRSRRGRELLALLALRAGREVERAWLAGLFWPESHPARGFLNLRRCLCDLRHALGPHAGCVLAPTPHTLRLDLRGVRVDAAQFDAAVARGDEASLEQAAALYRGPLLEDCSEEWVLPERAWRERAYLQALESLAARALARADPARAAHFLHLAAAAEPLCESTQRRLLEALAANGDYAAVKQVYRDLRLRLHREVNAAPSPETTALYERLQATQKAKGERRKAEEDSSYPPLAVQASPIRNPQSAIRNPQGRLPHPLTPLIGREEDVAQVRARLAAVRLVTLTGTGGVGKTRLALQVAHEVKEQYADGAWFVDLAALSDPALVPQAVVTALGLRGRLDQPALETLLAALEGRKALLLLDNCEHLIAACAELAAALLGGCPELRLLATSREPLGLRGEVLWHVPPLPVPGESSEFKVPSSELGTAFSQLGTRNSELGTLNWPSVRLFVERARDVQPAFQATAENLQAVAEVCRHLDGLPLAIELAAARVAVLTVPEIAARLAEPQGASLRLLASEGRGMPPRQQTLRRTLDWSYTLLSEPEQAVLRRLSVFPAGFTLEAVEAVVSGQWSVVSGEGVQAFGRSGVQGPEGGQGPGVGGQGEQGTPNPQSAIPNPQLDVLDLLSRLAAKSLVVVEYPHPPTPQHLNTPTPQHLNARTPERPTSTRYRLLETIREYAGERLVEAGEAGMAGERHADFFLSRITGWKDSYDEAWFKFLERDYPNVRAALEWSLAAPDSRCAGPAVHAAWAIQSFWFYRGYQAEGRAWWERALARQDWLPPGLRATVLRLAGDLVLCGVSSAADYAVAGAFFEAAAADARQHGDMAALAAALGSLGRAARLQGHLVEACSLCEEGLVLARAAGDESFLLCSLLLELGWTAAELGDGQQALACAEESLAIYRGLNDLPGTATALHLAGIVLAEQLGDLTQARSRLEECLALRRRLGSPQAIAWSLADLGNLARQEGNLAEARALYQESLALRGELGDRVGVAGVLSELAFVALDEGDAAAARPLLEESLALRRQLGELPGVARMLLYLGKVARWQGNLPAARRLYEESLALGRELKHAWVIPSALLGLGLVHTAAGEYEQARSRMEEAVALWQQPGDPQGVARALRAFGSLAAARLPAPEGPGRAALLFGAAEALEEAAGVAEGLHDRVDYDPVPASARAALGEAAFTAAWAAGRRLTPEQALACALEEDLPADETSRTRLPVSRHPTHRRHVRRVQ